MANQIAQVLYTDGIEDSRDKELIRMIHARYGAAFRTASIYNPSVEDDFYEWFVATQDPDTNLWDVHCYQSSSLGLETERTHKDLCVFDALYVCAYAEKVADSFGGTLNHDDFNDVHFRAFAEKEGQVFDRTGLPVPIADGRLVLGGKVSLSTGADEIMRRAKGNMRRAKEKPRLDSGAVVAGTALQVTKGAANNLPALPKEIEENAGKRNQLMKVSTAFAQATQGGFLKQKSGPFPLVSAAVASPVLLAPVTFLSGLSLYETADGLTWGAVQLTQLVFMYAACAIPTVAGVYLAKYAKNRMPGSLQGSRKELEKQLAEFETMLENIHDDNLTDAFNKAVTDISMAYRVLSARCSNRELAKLKQSTASGFFQSFSRGRGLKKWERYLAEDRASLQEEGRKRFLSKDDLAVWEAFVDREINNTKVEDKLNAAINTTFKEVFDAIKDSDAAIMDKENDDPELEFKFEFEPVNEQYKIGTTPKI